MADIVKLTNLNTPESTGSFSGVDGRTYLVTGDITVNGSDNYTTGDHYTFVTGDTIVDNATSTLTKVVIIDDLNGIEINGGLTDFIISPTNFQIEDIRDSVDTRDFVVAGELSGERRSADDTVLYVSFSTGTDFDRAFKDYNQDQIEKVSGETSIQVEISNNNATSTAPKYLDTDPNSNGKQVRYTLPEDWTDGIKLSRVRIDSKEDDPRTYAIQIEKKESGDNKFVSDPNAKFTVTNDVGLNVTVSNVQYEAGTKIKVKLVDIADEVSIVTGTLSWERVITGLL